MITDSLLLDWMAVRLAPEISRSRFYVLMGRFSSPEAVFGASAAEIASLKGFSKEIAADLLKSKDSDVAKRHIDRMGRAGITVLTRDNPDYPFGLKNSSLMPPLLFVKGTLVPEDKYSVAMVGSRHATVYGRSVARELSGGLARYGLTIISGFARGIDGEAHHATINAGGRTIGVLGNGLDVCYPSEHRALGESVLANGALISEYPLGTSPDRFNFPERNHVIAALAMGTIVVEAAEKSGSLITARLAVEENRFIFAVPGDITRNNSRGANVLIQNGARLVQRAQDVLVEMKDVLRGYLDVDQLEKDQAKGAGQGQSQSDEDRRIKDKKDWVDGINNLSEEELEVLAAELKLDDGTNKAAPAKKKTVVEPPQKPLPKAPSSATPPGFNYSSADTLIDPPGVTGRRSESDAPPIGQPLGQGEATRRPSNRIPVKNLADAVSELDFTGPVKPVSTPPSALTAQEKIIMDLLRHEAMVFDDLADRAFGHGIDVPRLTSILMKLEMKRFIRQLPGRYYVLFT